MNQVVEVRDAQEMQQELLKEALARPGVREVMDVYQNWQRADHGLDSYREATKEPYIITTTAHANLVRDAQAFQDAFSELVYEGARTLEAADAQAGERHRWWTGVVQGVHGLEVGFVFDLRRELPPMGELLGRYRLVAMAVNPEGHYALVAYEEDFDPPNGRPVPVVALMAHLVPR